MSQFRLRPGFPPEARPGIEPRARPRPDRMRGNKRRSSLYMSSPIYSARRPIPANVVAEKAAGYTDFSDRRLLFFLQALSMQQGGLRAASEDFERRFPGVTLAVRDMSGEDAEADFAAYLAGAEAGYGFRPPLIGGGISHDLLLDLAINLDFDLEHFKTGPAGAAL